MDVLKRAGIGLVAAVLAACGGGGGDDELADARSDATASPPALQAQLRAATAAPLALVALRPTDLDFPNPERGFYRFATDPAQITATSLQYVVQDGQRLVYTPADLSAYRTRNLPASYLAKLDTGFANLRKQGLKAVLRFAYNYPRTESDYLNARDATLTQVKRHLVQLQPVLERNADVIAVVQGGFIGAWGEWHTSSNGLTTPARKVAVRDALLAAVPTGLPLHLRYPADLAGWYPAPATLEQWLSPAPPAAARIGLHNDCFLASADDVGTYFSQTAAESASLRAYAQQASAVTGAGGETCAPPVPTQARMECADILREGAAYHMSYLNRDYYAGFFAQWQAGGCFDEVSRRLGYRLALNEVTHSTVVARGDTLAWSVSLVNNGWARPMKARGLVMSLVDARGQVAVLPLPDTDLRQAGSGQTLQWSGQVALPATLAAGLYRVHLGAPDMAAGLARDPAYALRFANADDPVAAVQWLPAQGMLALGTTVQVQ